jgi:hypothetical protein
MSAPWWHPESNPLADIRKFMRAVEKGATPEDLQELFSASGEGTVEDLLQKLEGE